jgi:outer membrane receptor protein involved in Fe transport
MFGDAGRGGHQPNEFVTPIHGFNRTDAQLLQRSFGEDGADEIFKPEPSAIGRWSVAGFPGGWRLRSDVTLSLGARYDLQTFTTKGLQSNPLWPDAGRVPYNTANVGPRVGLAYSIGNERPLVIRAGFGLLHSHSADLHFRDSER